MHLLLRALQMQRQKVTAGRGTPLLQSPLEDIGIGQVCGQPVHTAYAGYVGDRLDVEGEDRNHRHLRAMA